MPIMKIFLSNVLLNIGVVNARNGHNMFIVIVNGNLKLVAFTMHEHSYISSFATIKGMTMNIDV